MSSEHTQADSGRRPDPAEGRPIRHAWLPYVALTLASIPLILYGLDHYSLVNGDEEIYHVVARSMLERGDFLRLQFYDEHRVYDTFMNAPLQYWARAALISILGDSLLSMRLLSALFAVASVLMTCRLARHVTGDPLAGFLAGAVQLTTLQFVYLHGARTGELEPVVLLLYTAIALQFIRGVESGRGFVLHHLLLGLLFNVKAPTLLIPILAELACFAALPSTRAHGSRYLRTAVVILPFAALWHVARMIALYEPFLAVMGEMAQQAAAHGAARGAGGRLDTLVFYTGTILFGAFPWSIVFPFALVHGLRGPAEADRVGDFEAPDRQRRRFVVLAFFVVAVFVFYGIVSKHHRWYIMPVYPLLAVFVGKWLRDLPGLDWSPRRLLAAALIVAGLVFTELNFDFDPFTMKSYLIPMRVRAREAFGLSPLLGLPLCVALAVALLYGLRARLTRPRRAIAAALLGAALLGLATLRVALPLQHLDHQSEMAALRTELDQRAAAGTLPAFPIEPSIALTWDARFNLADAYEIERLAGGRFRLWPRGATRPALDAEGGAPPSPPAPAPP